MNYLNLLINLKIRPTFQCQEPVCIPPAKFICCNTFCLIYSRWVIPIELIKFQKPTKSCRSSCCFHLQWNARRISEHPGRVWSWKFDEMPSNVGTDNKMCWAETLEFTWLYLVVKFIERETHQFCDELHFWFVCVKLPLQCTWDHTNFSSVQRKLIRKNLNFLGNGR